MSCFHKTSEDHTLLLIGKARRWRCSQCGKWDCWGPTWSFHGALECPLCSRTVVELVACSAECAKLLDFEGRATNEGATYQ